MNRKLRVWDIKVLSDVYVLLGQMQSAIEQITKNTAAQSLADLPNSMIPTQTLYEISLCYELMYSKLLEHDLLDTGNIKSTHTIH